MTYHDNQQYRDGMIAFCIEQAPQFFVTLAYHRSGPVDIRRAQDQLHHFHAQLDRRLTGRRWHRLPPDQRTQSIALPEGRRVAKCSYGVDGLHFHLLLSPPRQSKLRIDTLILQNLMTKLWQTAVPSGDVVVKAVQSVAGVASYVSKRLADMESLGRDWFILEPRATSSAHRPRLGVLPATQVQFT